MAQTIQIRRDTAANWTASDPTMAVGEFGFETDTSKLKIGDGVTAWTGLGYFGSGGGGGIGGTLGSWKFDSTTTAGPSAGFFRANNATPASITTVWINEENADGVDMSNFLARLEVDDLLYIQQEDDSTKAVLLEIDSVTDSGTYYSYGVTYIDEGTGGLWATPNKRCGMVVSVEPPVASEIAFTPAGDVASTNVQLAIEEVDLEKARLLSVLDSSGSGTTVG